MKIVKEFPPNYKKICKVFDIKEKSGIIFTYGDTVYHPQGNPLPQHIITHEQTHINQQREMGAEAWWERYLVDPEFRLDQELRAYQAQWKIIQKIRNWREVESLLSDISKDLSSEMYGNVVTHAEAKKLIRGGK